MQLSLSKNMTNQQIADVMEFISGVLELQGANRFRVRAYDNAASAIAAHTEALKEMHEAHKDLSKVPGVGKTIAEKLTELFTTGNIEAFQKYVSDIPGATLPLSQLHGIGVKKAYKISTAFNLENPDTALQDVKKLAEDNKISYLDGFGEKSQADLITIIATHFESKRMSYKVARQIADVFLKELITCEAIEKAEALGSLRRQSPTVGDIDIGIVTNDIGSVKTFVKNMKSVKRVVVSGAQLLRVIIEPNHQVDIKVATKEEWGSFLQHFTGSKEHNIKLRELALKKNLSLSEHGIKDTETGKLHLFADEKKFYAFLGLNWIAPSKRLGDTEIEEVVIK
jgi:DNA polymerase (family 10)